MGDLRAAIAAAFLTTFLLPAPARPDQALEAAGGGAALVVRGGQARLETAAGAVTRLDWESGAIASAVHETAGGWLVAGTHAPVAPAAPADRQPRLFFVAVQADALERLPAPAPLAAGVRQMHPLPFVDQGRLAGAVWLEGVRDDALGVRAAAWDGERFRRPEWVSPPRRGSQMALAGAVLGDGSWLLAWTAFDGGDDEVMWSRRVGSVWQAPARVDVDDSWPDITPALTATRAGALLAWSGYDGTSYRTVLARFSGQGWEAPTAVGGPGSLYPAFRGAGEPPHLLYFDARGQSWRVIELDPGGRPLRRATVAAPAGDETPLLATQSAGAGEIALRWPVAGRRALGVWREIR